MKRSNLVLASCALFACGPQFVSDDVAILDAQLVDTTLPRDAMIEEGGGGDAWVDVTQFNGGGAFLCIDCVCDGTLNMCFNGGGGGGAPVVADAGDAGDAGDASPFGDASSCPEDAAYSGCLQIPVQCLPKPTCACIGPIVGGGGCTCSVDPSGNGFVITCPPKP